MAFCDTFTSILFLIFGCKILNAGNVKNMFFELITERFNFFNGLYLLTRISFCLQFLCYTLVLRRAFE